VLPDALEKHCIQAEPILDKNALAGKKAASAHLLLWICRRFSTDAAVLQRFCRQGCLFADASAASVRLSASSCWQKVVVLSCTGVGLATFFLKTKTREQCWRFLSPGHSRREAGFSHAQPLPCIS